MGNRAAEQYLLRVKRGLVCGRADRDYLFARFRQLADGFQEELPEAGYAEFVAAFGRPEDCAAELLPRWENPVWNPPVKNAEPSAGAFWQS